MDTDSGSGSIDPIGLLRRLAALPHRAAGTPEERDALELLTGQLREMGAEVCEEPFRTPKTYHVTLAWLMGLLLLGLWLAPEIPVIGAALSLSALAMSALYFDWRYSPVVALPPRVTSANLVARRGSAQRNQRTLILMAHYDSAPISTLYRPQMVAGFRRSLLISLGLMGLTAALAVAVAMGARPPLFGALRIGLTLYFLAQLGLSCFDFLRYGYSNAANDNGSGVAAAVAVAERLWRQTTPGWNVELVLTGAEEAGMIGALAYFTQHRPDPKRTWLLNIDTVGFQNLAVVERTGTLTDTVYHNPMFDAAQRLAREDARFTDVRTATHRLADFDSVWFARAGMPCVTLASYRPNGLMSGIHRPEDRMECVTPATVRQATDFAEALAQSVMEKDAPGAG